MVKNKSKSKSKTLKNKNSLDTFVKLAKKYGLSQSGSKKQIAGTT